MSEITTRDEWLAQIKQGVHGKVGDNNWSEDSWTEFVKEMAWWLHTEKSANDRHTIDAAAGLIKYGIEKEDYLKDIAGSPPDNEKFNRKLEAKGVPPFVCDMLFNKYTPRGIPQRQSKRRKDLHNLSPLEVVKELRDLAAPQIGTAGFAENSKVFRWPYDETVSTWNSTEMRNQLCQKREIIHERLKIYQRNDRQNVVIGVRLGSGFGKTHVLTEAPNLLNAQGLYVTYNLNQNLTQDRDSPMHALLVRLMLSACGCSQQNCGEFIRSDNFEHFRRLPAEFLRNCFVVLAKNTLKWGEIVIGIDEVLLLGEDNVKIVISELAELSYVYTVTNPKSRCTCVVSSLSDKAFTTKSGRSVEDWIPRHPDGTTLEHFAAAITSMGKEESLALASAVCGSHVRSIALAFREIKRGTHPTVLSLLTEMSEKLGNKISDNDFYEIRKYVEDCIQCFEVPPPSCAVEQIVGKEKALPPVIMAKAFKEEIGELQLLALLNSFSLFDGGAGKQLETIGKCYDLFRAARRLPVIPARAKIYRTSHSKPAQWYRNLVFQDTTEESDENLLKTQSVLGREKRGKHMEVVPTGEKQTRTEVVPTGIKPELGKYYHPVSTTHPWIDRLVVGVHKHDGSRCMVIYQDKVNQKDFASACKNLDRAADLLSETFGLKEVLLVVNVIGASESTRAQASLKWPYILVREAETEIRDFFSCNFAHMVEFARKRHILSLTKSNNKRAG